MLLSIFTETWPYLVPFISSLLSAGVGYLLARIGRSYTETKEEKQNREKAVQAEKDAVKARLDATESALKTEREARALAVLKLEGDLAAVAGILKEYTEFSRMLTSVAANVSSHEKRLDRHDTNFDKVDEALESIRGHVQELSMRRPLQL